MELLTIWQYFESFMSEKYKYSDNSYFLCYFLQERREGSSAGSEETERFFVPQYIL